MLLEKVGEWAWFGLVNSLLSKKIYCTHGHCCLEGAIKSNATFSMTNWLRAQTEIQTIGFDRFRFAPFFAQFSLRCVGLQRSILLSVCLQFCNQTRVSFCKKNFHNQQNFTVRQTNVRKCFYFKEWKQTKTI